MVRGVACCILKITVGEDDSSGLWWLSSVRRVGGRKVGYDCCCARVPLIRMFRGRNPTTKATTSFLRSTSLPFLFDFGLRSLLVQINVETQNPLK
jgi:hypothetical protein